jgi:hypothetical protein
MSTSFEQMERKIDSLRELKNKQNLAGNFEIKEQDEYSDIVDTLDLTNPQGL